jgi:hypothetical protein
MIALVAWRISLAAWRITLAAWRITLVAWRITLKIMSELQAIYRGTFLTGTYADDN